MPEITIRDMEETDAHFTSTCSHVNESEEQDACGARRLALLRDLVADGAKIKAALLDGEHVGFAYGLPIEHASWGPLGEGLMVVPCLYVLEKAAGHDIGRALLDAIEQDAREAGGKGVTIVAYRDLDGADWFMPAAYFEQIGYEAVDVRAKESLLWKPFTVDAKPPRFLEPEYTFEPVVGKVIVDLFWNAFCQTSNIEAQRVREVCVEFGDRVILNEYCSEDREVLLSCQIPRAIYVNGNEIGWGYEAPKDGIREAIEQAIGVL